MDNLELQDGTDKDSQKTPVPSREHENAIASSSQKDEEAVRQASPVPARDDPNAVNWDGPDDPDSPMNWPAKRKWSNLIALSVMTLLTPLGSSMFAPGVPNIMRDFHSSNENVATFVVSVYILGFAFGPLLAAPMSEIYGRAICYNVANVLFIVFTVATALSVNMPMLIIFRFLMGFAGSTPITNGSGTISDMFPLEERGKAMAIWAMGPLLGPCIGPVAGGYVVENLNWRWVFWIIAIAAGVISAGCYFLVTETYHPTLLRARTRRLKKETGNNDLHCALDDEAMSEKRRFQLAIIRPLKMLVTLPSIFLLALYVAVVYGMLYLLFSTFTFVFSEQYGFSSGTVGLSYVPTGVGMLFGITTFGALTDLIIKKKMAKGETPEPEDRLPLFLTVTSGVAISAALFWYGWAIEANTHWIVPMLGVVLFSFGLMGVMMCVQVYLVDCYITYAASVIAAITVLRSFVGALLPLAGLSMYDALGFGWGNSVLAFIALVLVPVPVAFRFYGKRIRTRFPAKL